MKKLFTLLSFILLAQFAYSGELAPHTGLYQIETKHFHILYSDATRDTAIRLATFADSLYLEINDHLQRRTTHKITVLLSDDYEGANGYSNPVPFNTIVLYVHPSPIDSVIGNNIDYFKALFYHELTHAISLTVRGPAMEWGYNIFGAWVSPQSYMMPWFMIEGVTVSYESLDGFGRVNNPYIGDDIRQDIAEGRMKGISQASGAYDLYPFGNVFYHYGGYFNHYLQEKYGMDKYRELWQRTGGGNPLLFLPGNFRRTYDLTLRQAWKDFGKSMQIPFSLINNTNSTTKKYSAILSTDTDGRMIYYQDVFDYNIYSYDTISRKKNLILHTDWMIGRISLSEDGTQLLISRSTLTRGKPRLLVQIYDLKKKSFLTQRFPGIREAAFYKDGIVAIRPRAYYTDLVYLTESSTTVLMRGGDEHAMGMPWAWKDNKILFSLKNKGVRQIAIYNTVSSNLSLLQSDLPLSHIRDLMVFDRQIYFSHHDDIGLYSWAMISNQTLYKYTNQISGGVHQPIPTVNGLYYVGRFSQGEKLMRWPEEWSTPLTSPVREQSVNISSNDILPDISLLNEKKYRALPYIRPHVWAPSFSYNQLTGLNELGVISYLSDPMRNNIIIPALAYSFIEPFINISASWQNSSFSLPWTLRVLDNVITNTSQSNSYRETRVGLSSGYTWNFLPVSHYLHLGVSLDHYAIAAGQSGKSAYRWDNTFQNTILGVWTRFSSYTSLYPRFKARGMQLTLYFDYHVQTSRTKWEASFHVTPEILPVSLTLHASYTPGSLQSMSGYHQSFLSTYAPTLPEYALQSESGDTYLYVNTSLPLFNLEIQRGTGAIPLYVNRIYAFAGYRGASLLSTYFHSVYSTLTLDMTWGNVFDFKAIAEFIYDFNSATPGKFFWGFSTDLSFLGLAQPGQDVNK